jgi:medium-chain acyl-[acyl-carrier-protein] hydrolase
VFARWMKAVPTEIEVCPVQLPGRENRIFEPCLTRVSDIAEQAAEALHPYFDMRFALFGYSLGALIAYELAQTLRRTRGLQPQHLIVAAHRAPHADFPLPPTWNLPDEDLKKRLETLNGTPKEVLEHEELLEMMLPLIRADFRLDETYTRPGDYEPLDCPITALGGRQDMETSVSNLQGWSEVTRSSFELKMLDGDHFFIHSQAAVLMQVIEDILKS